MKASFSKEKRCCFIAPLQEDGGIKKSPALRGTYYYIIQLKTYFFFLAAFFLAAFLFGAAFFLAAFFFVAMFFRI